MDFTAVIALAARLIEAAGVATMFFGAVVAGAFAVLDLARRGRRVAFRAFRQNLGRAILLGLEFLVAADIIRTVSQVPTLEGVIVLAIIVAIRTFLSFTLELELEGRWPWQSGRGDLAEAEAAETGPIVPPPGAAEDRPPLHS